MRVLIVDDDPVALLILERGLQKLGHEPVVARGGELGWQAFVAEKLECVVTDWSMPGVSGLDLCRRIRSAPERAHAFILLLTGKDRREDLIEGLQAGADEFMVKPLDPEVLRARLHTAERVLGLENRLAERVKELEATLAEVKTLRGLIPICMYCKRVRPGKGDWQRIESYVSSHSHATFSHGICPGCWDRNHSDEPAGSTVA